VNFRWPLTHNARRARWHPWGEVVKIGKNIDRLLGDSFRINSRYTEQAVKVKPSGPKIEV
jgi:hypothetical protein